MMLYRNMKDTDFFYIVAGVLQGDTLALYLFIICLDYVLRTLIALIKENGFTQKKTKSRQYSAETITDAVYADDIAFLANTPTQAKSLLHSLEQAARKVGLHVNANKTEYMSFNQEGNISTLNGDHLPPISKNHPNKKKQGWNHKWHSHMDLPVLADQEEVTYNSSVGTEDVVSKTCWER